MTKAELICSLIVMAVSLIIATIFLSDRISERKMEYKKLKTVMLLVLSIYSSLGLATFVEIYYSPDFKLWQVFLIGFSIFSAYLVISVIIGLHKAKKDEEKKWKVELNREKRNNTRIVMKNDIVARNDSCRSMNACCKIMNIAEARNYRK